MAARCLRAAGLRTPRRVKVPVRTISSQLVRNGATLISQRFSLKPAWFGPTLSMSPPLHVEGALGRGSQPRPAFFPAGVFLAEKPQDLGEGSNYFRKPSHRLFSFAAPPFSRQPQRTVGVFSRFRVLLHLGRRASAICVSFGSPRFDFCSFLAVRHFFP